MFVVVTTAWSRVIGPMSKAAIRREKLRPTGYSCCQHQLSTNSCRMNSRPETLPKTTSNGTIDTATNKIKYANGGTDSDTTDSSQVNGIKAEDVDNDTKSLFTAYFLWFFFGIFGLHHVYLKRDRHAFVSWMTCGCYFGVGWLRESWRLPEYVSDYNMDTGAYVTFIGSQIAKHKTPPSSFARHFGTIIVADVLGYLVLGALPLDYLPTGSLPTLTAVLVPLGVAIGVHTVGNIGHQEGSLKWPLIGAYITAPLYLFSSNSVFWTSMASYYCFNNYGRTWRRTHYKKKVSKSLFKRLFWLFMACSIYTSLWCSWIFFNCTITDSDDEEIKCRDAIKRFFNSPFWTQFSQVIVDLWNYSKHHGWSGFWQEIIEAMDASGESNALRVLNVTKTASQEEITASYRKLSRKYHPDRFKDETEKATASDTFIEIQQSYEILSRKKFKRIRMNKRERENPDEFVNQRRDEL